MVVVDVVVVVSGIIIIETILKDENNPVDRLKPIICYNWFSRANPFS